MKTVLKQLRDDWSRAFWSELVNRSSLLSRRENAAEVLGWSVRLVWDEGHRGTLYLNDPRWALHRRESLRYIFAEFDPRREAQLLLRQIAPYDVNAR